MLIAIVHAICLNLDSYLYEIVSPVILNSLDRIYILTLIYCCWWLIWSIQNDAKKLKNYETLEHRYSSESTQQELSNECQHDILGLDDFQKPCALDESSLSIGRVRRKGMPVQSSENLISTYDIE